MKVAAEVTITILEGERKGQQDFFTKIVDTDTEYTKYGIIERVKIEWLYIRNMFEQYKEKKHE